MTSPEAPAKSTGALYRAIWRWHFYAGLFAIPFIIFLSITGSIYLFRPQIETWLDRPYNNMVSPQTASPSEVAAVVLAQNRGWIVSKYQLPQSQKSAAQILISREGIERRVYVDRSNLQIIKSVEEQSRPMMLIFRLHGELLAGDRGSNLVELAASWTIILIVTGLFLWWPRNASGLGGVLYPRLGRGGRITLRDLHAVTGIWVSILVLFFLFSGLPWASNWGSYFRTIRAMTGTAPITQSWFAGPGEEKRALQAQEAAHHHAAHMGMTGMPQETVSVPLGLDRAVAAASQQRLVQPVLLMAPPPGGARWKAVSQSLNVPQNSFVIIDGRSGDVLSRTDFHQGHWIDRLVGYTTAMHQGQLFGWINQLLNLMLALSLIAMSISAILMWLRRRAPETLGAPQPLGPLGWSWSLVAVVLVLGALLPEFLVSLLAVLLLEWAVLRRIPPVKRWLAIPSN